MVYYYLLSFDCFSLFLSFLISLIKLILWLKFFFFFFPTDKRQAEDVGYKDHRVLFSFSRKKKRMGSPASQVKKVFLEVK